MTQGQESETRERGRRASVDPESGEVHGSGSGAGGGGAPEDYDDDPVGGGGADPHAHPGGLDEAKDPQRQNEGT